MTTILLVALIQVSAPGANQTSFEQAYSQSVETGRPLVVLIGATWCRGCEIMRTSIMPQVARQGGLDRVVFTYVDYDQQRQLALRLKRSDAIPQLIRFDRTASGWKPSYLVGAKSPREVHHFINVGLSERQIANVDRKAANTNKTTAGADKQTTSADNPEVNVEKTKASPVSKPNRFGDQPAEPPSSRTPGPATAAAWSPGVPPTKSESAVETEARVRPIGPIIIPAHPGQRAILPTG